MKKITIVSFCSFAFLFICSLIAVLTEDLFSVFWSPMIIGIVLLSASGIIALIIKEKMEINLICFMISSISMGFLIRGWYILRGLDNTLTTTTIISLVCVLYLWVYFSLTRIPFVRRSNKLSAVCTVMYFALTLAIYLYFVFTTKTAFLSTLGYYMLIEAAFIFAMVLEVHSKEELVRNLTLSTYSVFVVAVIVAVIAIAAAFGDGDCDLDCCDGDCCCETVDFSADVGQDSAMRKNKKKKQ